MSKQVWYEATVKLKLKCDVTDEVLEMAKENSENEAGRKFSYADVVEEINKGINAQFMTIISETAGSGTEINIEIDGHTELIEVNDGNNK